MSLVGIRDISVIETPPVSRIPTAVKVCEFSKSVLSSAIENELSRNGQVLIVYNRVESIYEFSNAIRNMFPNVNIDIAHGQMEQSKLEEAIFKLYNNDTQVLISTTLIENGVDLPNANTLIVINADMLGLSQLYQLKGRVGRSDKQAFAYFMYDGGKLLNETALKRLEAITEYTSMGSGFKIALKDLEIRGAGSIFGAEQSGHIEKVGYAMYLKLLSESVSEIKGEKVNKKTEVKVETSLNAYIPNDYISDYNQRMSTYLKISKIDSTSKLLEVITHISDIYGEIQEEVTNLCKVALIKNLSEKLGISRVVVKLRQVELHLTEINETLLNAINHFSKYMVFENKNQPIIKVSKDLDLLKSVDLIINFLEFMSN
jgi:transcription-repair coupling factor (superfamily II helicase)